MRTTVTIDEDVARELKKRAKQADKSFKQVLNDSLRLAFSLSRAPSHRVKRFRVRPHKSAFREGIDLEKLNQLSDQLEIEDQGRLLRHTR